MAITVGTTTYLGGPLAAAAQGQQYSMSGISGPTSAVVTGICTLTLDGSSTTATVNFIDGVQKLFNTKTVVITGLTVAAPATIGGTANQVIISGVGAFGQFKVGQSVTFAGFSNSGNNGPFTIVAITTSTLQITNASGVAETNPAATVTGVNGALVLAVDIQRANASAAGAADTAALATTVTAGGPTQTGFPVTISAAGSSAQTLTVLFEVYPNS